MTNSRYRCQGCRQYKPQPPFRRVGLGGVCSDDCQAAVNEKRNQQQRTASTARPRDEIPVDVRKMVLRRDRARCRWCGSMSVHLHHINYRSEGVDHQPHNLITLCPEHHDKVHSDKKRWKPVLLAVIWTLYVNGRSVTVPQMARQLDSENA